MNDRLNFLLWGALSIGPTCSGLAFLLLWLLGLVDRSISLHWGLYSPYFLSLRGVNHTLSFRCHLHANTFEPISTPNISELRPLNPTLYFIFLLRCLKFLTCPDRTQDLPSSPDLFSCRVSYHTSHCTSQKSVNHPWNCLLPRSGAYSLPSPADFAC